jgi:hypothetical protein
MAGRNESSILPVSSSRGSILLVLLVQIFKFALYFFSTVQITLPLHPLVALQQPLNPHFDMRDFRKNRAANGLKSQADLDKVEQVKRSKQRGRNWVEDRLRLRPIGE